MKILTIDGRELKSLERLGAAWAETFIDGGIDDVTIDLGEMAIFSDFIATIMQLELLTLKSVQTLEKEFFNSPLNALEVEEGAKEYLLANGYYQEGKYYFKRK